MRVLFCELKKIFRPLRTLAVLLFIALFFSVYVYGICIDHLSINGVRQGIAVNEFLHETYGANLSAEERADADKYLVGHFKDIFTDRIKNDEILKAGGAADYDSINALMKRYEYAELIEQGEKNFEEYGLEAYDPAKDYSLTKAEKEAVEHFMSLDGGGTMFDLDMASNAKTLLFSYDRVHDGKDRTNEYLYKPTSAEAARFRELMSGDDINSTIPGSVSTTVYKMAGLGTLMIVLSVFILLAPVITADNFSGTSLLQYTSKTGRSILKKQFAAYLLAAAFLTAVQLAVMFISLYLSSAGAFFDCKLVDFQGFIFNLSWFKGTLIQYLAVVAGLICLLTCACTTAVFLISKSGKNYISLLLKGLPLALALTAFCFLCTYDAFAFSTGYQYRNWYYFIPVPFIEVYVCAALFIGLTAAVIVVLKKQNKKEIFLNG